MSGYINYSGNYDFKEFGVVHVNVRSSAKTLRVRWKGAELLVSAPTGIPYDRVMDFLREIAPKLESAKPEVMYNIGDLLDFGELKVSIEGQSRLPDRILANLKGYEGRIQIGLQWDLHGADTMKTVSKFLCRMAQQIAPTVLLPRARDVALRVGKYPERWEISNGHRILGHCSSRGVISLSYALVFYPHHLRDYVICHELAHLTEMNHSVRFHEICDKYCGGREKELIKQLKEHRTPIVH